MRHGSDWYQRDPQAYLGGVQGMSAKEHAVYSVVLDLIYLHGGSVNNDPRWIAGWIADMGAAAVRKAIQSLEERGKLIIEGDQITQKRAKTQAKTKENLRETARENGKKGGKKSAEIRATSSKNKDLGEATASTKTQAEKRREEKSIGSGDGSACAREQNHDGDRTEREIVLEAIGADPISGLIGPNGQCIGRLIDMQEFRSWKQDLGLELPEIIEVIRDVMARKQDGPPSTFTYFTQPMQRFAGQKSRPALTPIEGGQNERNRQGGTDRHPSAASRAHQGLIAGFARAVSEEP